MNIRVLVVDHAPGIALKLGLVAWGNNPNIEITINIHNLTETDIKFIESLQKDNKLNIRQTCFNPRCIEKIIGEVEKNNGYTVIISRLILPFNSSLLKKLVSESLTQPLKIIGQAGSNINHVDKNSAASLGIQVVYTPGSNSNAVAEYVITQILSSITRIDTYNKLSHQAIWSKYKIPPRSELSEKTLGLIGFGHIAQQVNTKAQALGMSVLAYEINTNRSEQFPNVKFVKNLRDLLINSDYVSIHALYSPATKNLINAEEINLMKNNSVLINTSRGGIVNESAVATELKKESSKFSHVYFDVFETEGDNFNSPLIGLKNATLTPHIAGTTNKALATASVQVVEKVLSMIDQIGVNNNTA